MVLFPLIIGCMYGCVAYVDHGVDARAPAFATAASSAIVAPVFAAAALNPVVTAHGVSGRTPASVAAAISPAALAGN